MSASKSVRASSLETARDREPAEQRDPGAERARLAVLVGLGVDVGVGVGERVVGHQRDRVVRRRAGVAAGGLAGRRGHDHEQHDGDERRDDQRGGDPPAGDCGDAPPAVGDPLAEAGDRGGRAAARRREALAGGVEPLARAARASRPRPAPLGPALPPGPWRRARAASGAARRPTRGGARRCCRGSAERSARGRPFAAAPRAWLPARAKVRAQGPARARGSARGRPSRRRRSPARVRRRATGCGSS